MSEPTYPAQNAQPAGVAPTVPIQPLPFSEPYVLTNIRPTQSPPASPLRGRAPRQASSGRSAQSPTSQLPASGNQFQDTQHQTVQINTASRQTVPIQTPPSQSPPNQRSFPPPSYTAPGYTARAIPRPSYAAPSYAAPGYAAPQPDTQRQNDVPGQGSYVRDQGSYLPDHDYPSVAYPAIADDQPQPFTMQPGPPRRQRWLVGAGVLALVLVLVCIGAVLVVGFGAKSVSDTIRNDEKEAGTDVALTGCATDRTTGLMTADITITNRGPDAASYVVDIAFADASGTKQFDSGVVTADGLAAGRTTIVHATAASVAPAAFTCAVVGATRF